MNVALKKNYRSLLHGSMLKSVVCILLCNSLIVVDSQTMAERQPSLDICSDEENEGCDGHEKILELELMKSFVPSFNVSDISSVNLNKEHWFW